MTDQALAERQQQTPQLHDSSKAGAEALARAQVETRYKLALHRPRSIDDVRTALLKDCERPSFAKVARYSIPFKAWDADTQSYISKPVEGWSIRYAEAAMRSMGNMSCEIVTVYDDDLKRVIRVQVVDLENNLSFGGEATIEKLTERRKLKEGQQAVAVRTNSYGDRVFLVHATEGDVAKKTNAEASKILRTQGLRHVPGWLLDECLERWTKTVTAEVAKDPDAERRALVDAFAEQGVKAAQLERYLGHGLDGATVHELIELRAIYAAVREGAAKWIDIEAMASEPTPKKGEDDPHKDVRSAVAAKAKEIAAKDKAKAKAPPARDGAEG